MFHVKSKILLPEDIIFSSYSYKKLPQVVKKLGSRLLILSGRRAFVESFWGQEILNSFVKNKIKFFHYRGIEPEPECKVVESAIRYARRNRVDLVLGIGGGSVLDVAKAVAGLFNEKFKSVSEYLYGKEIKTRGLPCITVTTTSGTGSEVTKNVVLKDRKNQIKTSIRDEKLLPRVALVDPVLTLTLPERETVYSALDALTHALESYVSKGGSLFTQTLSLKSAELIYNYLPRCLNHLPDLQLREKLSFASLIAGIAFSNAGLGLAHALSHPIGMLFNLPHGLVNAILIPEVIKFNYKTAGSRYTKLVKFILSKNNSIPALDNLLKDFNKRVNLPLKFSQLGIILDEGTIRKIVERVKYSGSLKYNPRDVTEDDIRGILSQIW